MFWERSKSFSSCRLFLRLIQIDGESTVPNILVSLGMRNQSHDRIGKMISHQDTLSRFYLRTVLLATAKKVDGAGLVANWYLKDYKPDPSSTRQKERGGFVLLDRLHTHYKTKVWDFYYAGKAHQVSLHVLFYRETWLAFFDSRGLLDVVGSKSDVLDGNWCLDFVAAPPDPTHLRQLPGGTLHHLLRLLPSVHSLQLLPNYLPQPLTSAKKNIRRQY